MKRFFSAALLIGVAGWAFAQEAELPLKRAKVGDYVVYKMTGSAAGTMRQEVVAVSDKDVTVKTVSTIAGMTLPADVKVFPLTSQPDPNAGNKDVKIIAESAGTETLKIGGKDYRCTWRAVTVLANAAGMEVKSESKVWISKDAPVFGMVKTVSTTFGTTTTVELSEAGAAK
jgi:hypothetical protein